MTLSDELASEPAPLHALRGVAQEFPGFRSFVDSVMQLHIAQGIVVDLNPIWLAAYELDQAGIDPDALYRFGPTRWPDMEHRDQLFGSRLAGAIDLKWSHDVVDRLTQVWFPRPIDNVAVIVKAIASPITDVELEIERRTLRNLVAEAGFLAIAETRPVATLIAGGGDAFTTLGGARAGLIAHGARVPAIARDEAGNVVAETVGVASVPLG